MDKDLRKTILITAILFLVVAAPSVYVWYNYNEKVKIEEGKPLEIPDKTPGDESSDKEDEEDRDKNTGSNISVSDKNVIGEIDIGEVVKKEEIIDEEEVEEPQAVPQEKEGLIIDNSDPNPFDKNNPSVDFGPTTGYMGSKINPTDPSGFKKNLENILNDEIEKIKTDPERVSKENIMFYNPKTEDAKFVYNFMKKELDDFASGKTKELRAPTAQKKEDGLYLVSTLDSYRIETVYNNPEGIMNEIKLQAPGFLRAAFLPELGGYSYDYGAVSIYYDAERQVNVVAMMLYNYIKFDNVK